VEEQAIASLYRARVRAVAGGETVRFVTMHSASTAQGPAALRTLNPGTMSCTEPRQQDPGRFFQWPLQAPGDTITDCCVK
jgi:hypothetical protein